MHKFNRAQVIICALVLIGIPVYVFGTGYLKKSRPKVLLIGLDGASWNVIQPLLAQGRLPNFQRLMDTGCWGVMKSQQPLMSEVIWTTIATSMPPEKHGVERRLMVDPDSGVHIPPSSNLRKVKAIWNILSENNKSVGIVHYMVTWPVEKVNGVMISGRVADLEDIDYQSRDRAYPSFSKLCSRQEFENFKTPKESVFAGLEPSRFLDFWWSIQCIDNFAVGISRHLLQKHDFDFFCTYIRGIDITSHNFWGFRFPAGFATSKEDAKKYGHVLDDYYIWCDRAIGDLLKAAGWNTTVIIVSDHGFTGDPAGVCFFSNVDGFLVACGIDRITEGDKTALLKDETPNNKSLIKDIAITGDCTEKEFNEARQQAKDVLKNIKVVETGEHLIDGITDTPDGFSVRTEKAFVPQALGRHYAVNGKEYKIADLVTANLVLGRHSESAVIVLAGRHILRNKKIAATISDITPTILYYLGLPVARDMDGKVLTQAIEADYLRGHPVRYIDSYETGTRPGPRKPLRSLLDEEKIKERMRSLGYID